MAAVDGTAVAPAVSVDRDGEGRAQGSVGAHGREPEDGHEKVERHVRPVVVGLVAADGLLTEEGVADDDQSEETL